MKKSIFLKNSFDSLDAGAGFVYSWTPGLETDQTIDVTAAANYGVTITDGNGCENK